MTEYEMLNEVIIPTLQHLNKVDVRFDTVYARGLLLGTAIAESQLKHIRQMGGGPALSYFQIEPTTANDVRASIKGSRLDGCVSSFEYVSTSFISQLAVNTRLACAIARIIYWRVREPIPTTGRELSYYHKKYYNTAAGAADPIKNTPIFERSLKLAQES